MPGPRWIAAGVAVAIGAAAVAVMSSGSSGPSQPDEWDPRVADLVQFVQDERGLLYDHPVEIDYLTAEEYSDLVASRDELTDSDIADIENFEGELRAVGLLSGDVDLVEAMGTLQDEGSLAFYDPDTQRITVRGSDLTPALRVTLVHELTHALQDQHFDLGRLYDFESSDAQDGFRALGEGDATRIENRYIDSLSDADRQSYEEDTSSDAPPELDSVPPVLVTFFGAPYVLGTDLVTLLEQTGGDKAVNAAFDTPPDSDAALLDPFRFVARDTSTAVDVPKLADGETEIDSGDMGALAIYLFLSTRLDPHEALDGIDGWDGDAYVAFEREDRVCFRVAIATVDDNAAEQLEAVLSKWSDAASGTDANVTRNGADLTFESCDPGPGATGVAFNDVAMALPVTRTEIGIEFVKRGVAPEAARCIAGKIVDVLSLDDITSDDPSQLQTPEFVAQVQTFAQECHAG